MTVKIWNQKTRELMVVMEWENGRLDYRRYRMIVSQLFMLACDGCENDKLVATFDNSPQRIETLTYHSEYHFNEIDMALYIDGNIVKLMNICN